MFNEAFGIYLRNKQVLTETLLTEHLNAAAENRVTLVKELIDSKVLSEATAYTHFASYMNIPIRDFQLTEINFDLIRMYPREKLILNCAIPYRDNDNSIIFAISDPFRLDGVADIERNLGKHIEYFLILPSKMNEILGYVSNKIQQNSVLDDFSSTDSDITEVAEDELTEEDAPVIVLCDSILKDAVARGASDIHIEPFETNVRIRYRIDGKLTLVNNLRPHLFQSILARFKIMSDLNIAERRIPQDGKISLVLNGSNYDFRVSTLPSIHGEKIVIRIYNKSLTTKDVAILGFNKKQEEIVYDAISRPHGIILLTGPTGSGKSTTLYTFLRHLNKEETNIITVEDPVENEISGITQVQVNPKADLTFASALRSILRQDPNVIMIGEIRDEETAQIAVRAALTGHLVFSTIHTNDAASVVSRLIDMGIAPYLVSDSLLCSISQRLVRRLCPFCKQEHVTNASETKLLKLAKPATIFEPKGCPACNHTGYQGRTAVFEIVPINSEIRSIVMDRLYTSEKLNKYVGENFPTLLDNARERVISGDTSISEYEDLLDVIVKDAGKDDDNDAVLEEIVKANEETTAVEIKTEKKITETKVEEAVKEETKIEEKQPEIVQEEIKEPKENEKRSVKTSKTKKVKEVADEVKKLAEEAKDLTQEEVVAETKEEIIQEEEKANQQENVEQQPIVEEEAVGQQSEIQEIVEEQPEAIEGLILEPKELEPREIIEQYSVEVEPSEQISADQEDAKEEVVVETKEEMKKDDVVEQQQEDVEQQSESEPETVIEQEPVVEKSEEVETEDVVKQQVDTENENVVEQQEENVEQQQNNEETVEQQETIIEENVVPAATVKGISIPVIEKKTESVQAFESKKEFKSVVITEEENRKKDKQKQNFLKNVVIRGRK